jgi:RNA polymerase sigma factor (sigma-70 family)
MPLIGFTVGSSTSGLAMHNQNDAKTLCRKAVRELAGRFGWQLLPEDEFAPRCFKVMTEKPAMTPKQACLYVYSQVLYDACQDARQQEQAYFELHYYLHRIACRCRPDVAADATQEALRLIFEQIHTCRNPRAFLRFAQFKLLQAIKSVERRRGWEEEFPEDGKPLKLISEDPDLPSDEDLLHCIRHVLETHPRARDQLRAVLWKYFDELSDEEIARRMGKSPAQVHVLRSRGMEKLRRCLARPETATGGKMVGSKCKK